MSRGTPEGRSLYRFLTSTLVLLVLGLPLLSRAQSSDGVEVSVGATVTHDSNLFRLADSVEPQSVGRESRTETIRSAAVGLRLEKQYSLQRLQLAVSQTTYRHDTHEQLDFDTLTYRGAWLWQLTSRLSGLLGADHTETAVPFSDFRGTQRNVRTTDNRTFGLEGALLARWRLILGAGTTKQTSRVPVAAEADFESERKEIGLNYLAASGSSLTLLARRVDGDYLSGTFVVGGVIDEGFREDQVEARVSWSATARSTLTGRLTKLDRAHPNLSTRDFSAKAWSAAYNWVATGKVQVTLTAQRDVFASLDPVSPYTNRDSVSLTPAWEATARTVIRPRLVRTRTEYVSTAPSVFAREETVDVAEFAIEWTPMRHLVLNASVLHEKGSSNQAGFNYKASVGRLGASLVF